MVTNAIWEVAQETARGHARNRYPVPGTRPSTYNKKGPWPKKGTPLRFRAKKGHPGNEILENEKVPRKIFFERSEFLIRTLPK